MPGFLNANIYAKQKINLTWSYIYCIIKQFLYTHFTFSLEPFILYLIFSYYLLFILLFIFKLGKYSDQTWGLGWIFFVKKSQRFSQLAVFVEISILYVCSCSEYIFVNVPLMLLLMCLFFMSTIIDFCIV